MAVMYKPTPAGQMRPLDLNFVAPPGRYSDVSYGPLTGSVVLKHLAYTICNLYLSPVVACYMLPYRMKKLCQLNKSCS